MACPSSRHFVIRRVMSTQKSLFTIVQPSALKKPESDTDRGDDTQVKKRKFCLKWLEEFQWSYCDSTEKRMKCWKFKVCLMRMAVNLNHCKILCTVQTIFQVILVTFFSLHPSTYCCYTTASHLCVPGTYRPI